MAEWTARSNDIPKQFTCDISTALLNAAVRAFGQSPSLAHYVDMMFEIAKGTEDSSIPPCYVRIDIAHLIKNVVTTAALKTSRKKVRDFYIRCVALLVKVDNIDEAFNLIKCVLTVANSSTEGKIIIDSAVL